MMRSRMLASFAALAILFLFSTAHADGGTLPPLTQSVVIDATPEELWPLLTEANEMRTWMAPQVEIDLRIGGRIRSSYVPGATLGGPETIEQEILAYEPHRMLAMRTVRAPEGFPFPNAIAKTWSVLRLEPVDRERTRLVITGLGYGEDAESRAMRGFFEEANPMLLETLAARFADPAEQGGESVIELLGQFRGDWIADQADPDGSRLRSWSRFTLGPDGRCMMGTNVLGDAARLAPHGATLMWQTPRSEGDEVRFVSVNERGAVASGLIRRRDGEERTLRWAWRMTNREGTVTDFQCDLTLESEDRYRMNLHRAAPDGSWSPMIEVRFTRVDEVPAEYRAAWEK